MSFVIRTVEETSIAVPTMEEQKIGQLDECLRSGVTFNPFRGKTNAGFMKNAEFHPRVSQEPY